MFENAYMYKLKGCPWENQAVDSTSFVKKKNHLFNITYESFLEVECWFNYNC